MQKPSILLGAVLGGLTSVLLVAVSYLGNQLAGLPFIPFDLFDWLARVLPGGVISFGIDSMVRFITSLSLGPIAATAKLLEQLQGLAYVVGGGVVFGIILAWVLRSRPLAGAQVGAAGGGVAFVLVGIMELGLARSIARDPLPAFLWLAILVVGWGLLLGVWLENAALAFAPLAAQPDGAHPAVSPSRRAFFRQVGGLVAATFAAWGIGWLVQNQRALADASRTAEAPAGPTLPPASPQPASTTAAPAVADTPGAPGATPVVNASTTSVAPTETTAGAVAPAPGTRPALTPLQDFYRIDIDTVPPSIDGATWSVKVSGLFDRPRPLTLADLQAYPAVTQPATMSCISNPIAGDLIGTANFKGAPLHVVLADLGLRPEAKSLEIRAADGFYESVTMEDLQDPRTLLVYAMDDQLLTQDHGYPLRIYIPDRYGMKQPKWITSIEATAERGAGYWVDRGWSLEARPQIVSVIDQVSTQPVNGRAPLGGIAWAGARGITKVEVQVDDGPWVEATLITPPIGPLTWVQWRYDWPVVSGTHSFTVRATDGTGVLQTSQRQSEAPDGATGYDSSTATF
jgi:DMSO/TMAO reductase YedYZ molybdopterin-dependent catalytic subunit